MARNRSKAQAETPLIAGVGWYSLEEWTKLKRVAADSEKLHDTYEQWVEAAEQAEQQLKRSGLSPRRVSVKVGPLMVWCAARQKPLDGKTRAEYVTGLIRAESETKK